MTSALSLHGCPCDVETTPWVSAVLQPETTRVAVTVADTPRHCRSCECRRESIPIVRIGLRPTKRLVLFRPTRGSRCRGVFSFPFRAPLSLYTYRCELRASVIVDFGLDVMLISALCLSGKTVSRVSGVI